MGSCYKSYAEVVQKGVMQPGGYSYRAFRSSGH